MRRRIAVDKNSAGGGSGYSERMSLVRTKIEAGIALVTLDNPPLNVVTVAMTKALDSTLEGLEADPEVRVLVLTGAGERAFCAGSDIREFAAFTGPEGRALERKMIAEMAMYGKLDKFPKPTVCAMNGSALGGGLELAACCDLLVAAENVLLALPEVKLGVFPGSGGPIRIARRIGEGRAKEMILLGEPVAASTALAWGLVNLVTRPGEALDGARELAMRLAELPGNALRICKEAVDLAFDYSQEEAMERSLRLSGEAFAHPEIEEGIRAFFAKQKPNFR